MAPDLTGEAGEGEQVIADGVEVLASELPGNLTALGHTQVMRWNQRDQWAISEHLVHEPLIEQADFDHVQAMLGQRAGTATSPRRTYRSRHPYILKSLVHCGICGRKMQGQHSHGVAYYRCRFPQEYALAKNVDHPRNVIMREDVLINPLDTWLVRDSAPYSGGTPSPPSSARPTPTCPPGRNPRRRTAHRRPV